MKVDLTQTEQKSLFGKVKGYSVGMKVTYTETEAAIIRNKNLGKAIALTWNEDDPRFGKIQLSVNELAKQTWGRDFPTPVHAQQFMNYLKDELKVVKSFIDGSGATKDQNESFEL